MGDAAMDGFVPLRTNHDVRPLQAVKVGSPPGSRSLHDFDSPSWPRHERRCFQGDQRRGGRMMLSLVARVRLMSE